MTGTSDTVTVLKDDLGQIEAWLDEPVTDENRFVRLIVLTALIQAISNRLKKVSTD